MLKSALYWNRCRVRTASEERDWCHCTWARSIGKTFCGCFSLSTFFANRDLARLYKPGGHNHGVLLWDVLLDIAARKIRVERNDRFEDYTTSTYEV